MPAQIHGRAGRIARPRSTPTCVRVDRGHARPRCYRGHRIGGAEQLHQSRRQGVLKVMSRWASDAGLHRCATVPGCRHLLSADEYFNVAFTCPTGGTLDIVADVVAWHRLALSDRRAHRELEVGGNTRRREASTTCSNPRLCSSCSTPREPASTRSFIEYTRLVDDQSERILAARSAQVSVPSSSSSPAGRGRAGFSEIVKRQRGR